MIKTILALLLLLSLNSGAKAQQVTGGPWVIESQIFINGMDSIIAYSRGASNNSAFFDLTQHKLNFVTSTLVAVTDSYGAFGTRPYTQTNNQLIIDSGVPVALANVNTQSFTTNHQALAPDNNLINVLMDVIITYVPENAPLPLDIISFVGRAAETSNELAWSVADVSNVDLIKLQYSANSDTFQTIYNVAPNDGEDLQNFQYSDVRRNGYYRLEVLDNDSSTEVSNLIAIHSENEIDPLTVNYSTYSVETSESSQWLRIIGSDGKTLLNNSGNNQLSFSKLPRGIYIAVAKLADGKLISKRIVR